MPKEHVVEQSGAACRLDRCQTALARGSEIVGENRIVWDESLGAPVMQNRPPCITGLQVRIALIVLLPAVDDAG